jgi:hypothetical protein
MAITIDFTGVTKPEWEHDTGSMTYERYEMDFRRGAFNTDVDTDGELDVETARSRKWAKQERCGGCFQYRSANGTCGCQD